MSRAPCISFPSAAAALECFQWLEDPYNFTIIKDAFQSTTRFGKLLKVTPYPAGRLLFLRFSASTGDAMGMNMVSKGDNWDLALVYLCFVHKFINNNSFRNKQSGGHPSTALSKCKN